MKTDLLHGVTPEAASDMMVRSTQWSNDFPALQKHISHTATLRINGKKSESFVLGLTVVNDGSLALLKENKQKQMI